MHPLKSYASRCVGHRIVKRKITASFHRAEVSGAIHFISYRFMFLLVSFVALVVLTSGFTIILNSDDGTEVNRLFWYADGYESSFNYLGRKYGEKYDTGLRFDVENIDPCVNIAYARLRFSSYGGEISTSAKFIIEGVLQGNPTGFSQVERPSLKNPKTINKVLFEIPDPWKTGSKKYPLYYFSPDIAPIINEILSLPDWGTGSEGKKIALTIKDISNPGETNYVRFDDFEGPSSTTAPPVLEVYKTAYDTFLGKELLGRVTDTSALVNVYSLLEIDSYIEFGIFPGCYVFRSPSCLNQPPEQPVEMVLHNLRPDTRYFYRIRFRKTGTLTFMKGVERTFHTQRKRGSAFSFAVTADEHVNKMYILPQNKEKVDNRDLYDLTLQNISQRKPDLFIALGDTVINKMTKGRDAADHREAKERYLELRRHIDAITHSVPFYLVIGNHEGEQGWYYDMLSESRSNRSSLAVVSTQARKDIVPNPGEDGFFKGNNDLIPEYGAREDYYAWEWGDALFVVLAPYWYTTTSPYGKDGWLWTLGKEQYDWFYETLHDSSAKWKFVFIHHLTSTLVHTGMEPPFYGRGGIEIVKYKVVGNPSFEWGGEDENGNYVFDQKRPGWSHGAIHDFLVEEGVTIVFHGHDHNYNKQDLDGIVYQECPKPNDSKYGAGLCHYLHGVMHNNSGHIQVTVDPEYVNVEYERAYLPGDGINGEIAHSYMITE